MKTLYLFCLLLIGMSAYSQTPFVTTDSTKWELSKETAEIKVKFLKGYFYLQGKSQKSINSKSITLHLDGGEFYLIKFEIKKNRTAPVLYSELLTGIKHLDLEQGEYGLVESNSYTFYTFSIL